MAYCGIRCLYAAALVDGVTFAATDLVKPEYVGSREGSSIEELELAAKSRGLRTFAFVNGTADSLRLSVHPVILHVESVPGSGKYDHFVLCLGTRGGNFLVLDTMLPPGEPARSLDSHDIELIWDGTGIIVSRTPIEDAMYSRSLSNIIAWGAAIIILVIAWKLWQRRRPSRTIARFALGGTSRVAAEVVAILALALVAPLAFALCANGGLLANGVQIQSVEQTHAAFFLPRISFAEAEKALAARSAVLVDARYAADYGSGHIPGAINVPVTASDALLRFYMRAIPRNFPVIVYCQSKGCPFSKSVAAALLQQGFTSVELLDGGWEEWSLWKHQT
jgi:rhodanese-related sulfurtransferase